MVETVAVIFASVAATSAGAATAVGAAASGVGGLLATNVIGSISIGQILSGAFSAFSALSSISEGRADAALFESQALQADFAARAEILKGRADALDLKRALNLQLANNLVAAGASGITSEGSVGAAQDSAQRQAELQLGLTRDEAEVRAGQRRQQARQFRLEASAAKRGGITKAIGTLGSFFLSGVGRGSIPAQPVNRAVAGRVSPGALGISRR